MRPFHALEVSARHQTRFSAVLNLLALLVRARRRPNQPHLRFLNHVCPDLSPAGHRPVELGGHERSVQVSVILAGSSSSSLLSASWDVSFLALCPATVRSQHRKQRPQPGLDYLTSSDSGSQRPITSLSSQWSCFSDGSLCDAACVLNRRLFCPSLNFVSGSNCVFFF